jgi:hypothetical protein
LNFGNVTVGNPSTKPINITNNTGKTIKVPVNGLTGKGFSLASLGDVSIADGATVPVNVVFNPLSKGASKGILKIVDDATGKTLKTVNPKGTGVTL